MLEESQFKPPKDSLIPPGHSTGTPSPIRSVQGREQDSREPPVTTLTGRVGDRAEELPSSRLILQTRSLRKRNETQLLMQLNRLLGPRQRPHDKGK